MAILILLDLEKRFCNSSEDISKRIQFQPYVMLGIWNHLDPVASVQLRSAVQELSGWRTVASCHTPVEEGMMIQTESPQIQKLRKNIIELGTYRSPAWLPNLWG